MKYYFWAACILLIGVFAVYLAQKKDSAPEGANKWKFSAIEKETLVRPAYFEDMKWKPDGVDVRAPASTKTK